ncbi:MAG: hypothetical protein C4343_05940 [Chloroflexota bacterium]
MWRRRPGQWLLVLSILVASACQAAPAATPMAPPAATAPNQSAPASPSGFGTTITLADFRIEPSSVQIVGPALRVLVTNAGPTPHNLTIRNAAGVVVLATPTLRPDTETVLSGTLTPGDYVMFCALPGHESLGMHAQLRVVGQP